ncbi:TcpE family conjugal transfer membrane protein [Enterococcus faecium]
MEWEPYDYSIVYAEPYRVQQITSNWRLPFPVALVNAATFCWSQSLNIYFYVHLLVGLFLFSTSRSCFYIGIPYLCVLALAKLKPDGKKCIFIYGIGFVI